MELFGNRFSKINTHFNEDFTSGFKYIPNYLPQDLHDYFYKAALAYAENSPYKTHHDGRQVLTGMQSDFYQKFFKVKTKIINNKERKKERKIIRGGLHKAALAYAENSPYKTHHDGRHVLSGKNKN